MRLCWSKSLTIPGMCANNSVTSRALITSEKDVN
jgi:hypothetical protein